MNALKDNSPIGVFAQFTDPVSARALLQAHSNAVFGRACLLVSCTILHSAYRSYLRPASWAKATLAVCYKVEVEGEDVRCLYMRIFLDSYSAQVWTALSASERLGAHHVPALDSIVWSFPNDPALPNVAAMLSPEIRRHLPYELLPTGWRFPQNAGLSAVELVSYVPEKSCLARYELTPPNRACAEPHALTLYGKTYRGERARQVAQRQASLWAMPNPDKAFRMAQPLGYSTELGMFWQLGVQGVALASVLDDANHRHYLTRVGRGLAYLHGIKLEGLATVSNQSLMADCIKKIDKLIGAHAAGTEQLEALRQKVLAVPEAAEQRLIYGDFHVGQLLADGEDVSFLDLDSLVIGEPEQDLAEFIVALMFAGVATAKLKLMSDLLLASYRAGATWPLSMPRLRWHAHIQFVTRVHRVYRELRTGWAAQLQRCLEAMSLADVVPQGDG